MNLECLATLVGLDDSACECFEDSRPETYNVSESGYFITELLPVRDNIIANKDCADNTIWDFLIRARSKAIRDVQNDLTIALTSIKRKPSGWRGTIGKFEERSINYTPEITQGVQIRSLCGKRMKDQILVIKAIWSNLGTSDPVTLTWNSTIPDFVPVEIQLNNVNGKWTRTEIQTPWSLELYNIFQECVYHDLTFLGAGLSPRINRVYCCSLPGWTQHVEVAGISSNDYELGKKYGRNSYMNGLALEGYFSCDALRWLCQLDELNAQGIKNDLSRAIQYSSAVNALNDMLKSNKVNHFTLLDAENGYKMRGRYQKAYNEKIDMIAKNTPSGFSACWGCDKEAHRIEYLMT